MSRRRKHGDSPGLKQTPRKGMATEECRSVVESGKRRLRAARCSGPQGPGERPPRPLPQQEQPPVAASCSKSNPEGETWAVGASLGLSASAPELQSPGWGWSLKSCFLSLGFSLKSSKLTRLYSRTTFIPEYEHCPVRLDHHLSPLPQELSCGVYLREER